MNKKKLILHGTWLVVAISAFLAGFNRAPQSLISTEVTTGQSGMSEQEGDEESLVRESTANRSLDQLLTESSELSERDIEVLGERFRTSASPIDRRLAFSQLLKGLTKENALLIREQIAHLDHRLPEFREFHYAWGAVSGEEAAIFGASTEEDDMSPALAGWASADPKKALAWFNALDMESDPRFETLFKDRKLEPNGLRQHLMHGLVQGLANTDPTMASEFVGSVAKGPHDRSAHRMMHSVVEAVLRTSKPSEAIKWAEAMSEGQGRNLAMTRIANRYVDEDPQAAASWAEAFTHRPDNANVVGEVGHRWAAKDPDAAVDWVSNLPESPGQQSGMHRALHEWANKDPSAASEYLNAMQDSPLKNAAISGFTRRLAWEDPLAAVAWAGTISAEEERAGTMIAVGHAWMRKDATAAADWAASAGLPEKVQQAILNPKRDR